MKVMDVSAPDRECTSYTIGEVISAAKTLPNGKAPGPDDVPNKLQRTSALLVPHRFIDTINKFFHEGVYPDR